MSQNLCSHCGAETAHESLRGLCPRCLFLLANEPEGTSADGAETPPAPGERLRYLGDYELLEEIARGGMGAVYRARQVSLNRVVALKLMLSGEFASRAERERFQIEAEGAARLQHPNIVSIHEIGSAHGQPYFSMDFVEGKSLAETIRGQRPTALQAAEMVRALADAVEYAHRKGILHRDLKPQNVLVDHEGRLRITDFGLAKKLDNASDLTVTGAVMGTPGYMAPEQASGATPLIGPATDVYGLGAILYELLTGQAPFREETAARTIVKVMEQEPVRPSKLVPTCPPALETICLKCLEKTPARRYASAQHLAEELGRFVRGEPILAVPAGAGRRAWSWCVRRPWVLTGAASVLIITLLGVVYGLWEQNRYLAWKAASPGTPRPFGEDISLVGMAAFAAMGVNWFISLGFYALAARRKIRGEFLGRNQLWLLGGIGAFQCAITLYSTTNFIARAVWKPNDLLISENELLVIVHLLYLWPGLLLCWEAARGMFAVGPGLAQVARMDAGLRLHVRISLALLAITGAVIAFDLFARLLVPDHGYGWPWPFQRSNYPAEFSSASIKKWWNLHYQAEADWAAGLRNHFKAVAGYFAALPLLLTMFWRDPTGNWRKVLPMPIMGFALVNLSLAVPILPAHLFAEAALAGLLASVFVLRAADVHASTAPPRYRMQDFRISPGEFWIGAAAAMAIIAVGLAAAPGGWKARVPVLVTAGGLAIVASAIVPRWRTLALDDKFALACLFGWAGAAEPWNLLGLAGAALAIWARKKARAVLLSRERAV